MLVPGAPSILACSTREQINPLNLWVRFGGTTDYTLHGPDLTTYNTYWFGSTCAAVGNAFPESQTIMDSMGNALGSAGVRLDAGSNFNISLWFGGYNPANTAFPGNGVPGISWNYAAQTLYYYYNDGVGLQSGSVPFVIGTLTFGESAYITFQAAGGGVGQKVYVTATGGRGGLAYTLTLTAPVLSRVGCDLYNGTTLTAQG